MNWVEKQLCVNRGASELPFPISLIKTLTILAAASFMAAGLATADQTNASGPSLIGNRFLTFNTVVRVRQIEVTRDTAHGPDESSVHTPAEARTFREAIASAWPGGRITWAFSWLALHDERESYRELRDLDLKKNLEIKLKICESAEELLVEPSILKAFNTLQKYHEQWREVGPVPRDNKDDVWERFKQITSIINKKHLIISPKRVQHRLQAAMELLNIFFFIVKRYYDRYGHQKVSDCCDSKPLKS
mgnify:CR=1 FL=1